MESISSGGCCLNNCRIGFLICLSLLVSACNSGSSDLAGQSDDVNELVRLSEQNTETLVVTSQENESNTITITQQEVLKTAGLLETEIELYESVSRQSQFSDVTQSELDELVSANALRALDLDSTTDENIVKFPYSEQLASSLLAMGVGNETLNSLIQKLYSPDIKPDRFYATRNAWDNLVSSNLENVRNQGQSFWGQTNYPFSVTYLDQLAKNYGPEMNGLDFLNYPDESLFEIKVWLANKNPGLPNDHVGWPISNGTRVVSVNAEMIQAKWSSNGLIVSHLEDGRFETTSESMFAMPTIHFQGVLNSFATEQYRAVQLPTQNSNLVLVVVMPNRGEFAAVQKQLSPEFFDGLMSSFEAVATEFYLPEFQLNTTLYKLAFPTAGSENPVDFSAVNGMGLLHAESFQPRKISCRSARLVTI